MHNRSWLCGVLACGLLFGCASRNNTRQASPEQLSAILGPLAGLAYKDVVFVAKQFYTVNQRWPRHSEEFRSFSQSRFDILAPYENLEISENAAGDCLLSFTSRQGYEAKITVFRPGK